MSGYMSGKRKRLARDLEREGLGDYSALGLSFDEAVEVMFEQRDLRKNGFSIPHPRICLRRARVRQEHAIKRMQNLSFDDLCEAKPKNSEEENEALLREIDDLFGLAPGEFQILGDEPWLDE